MSDKPKVRLIEGSDDVPLEQVEKEIEQIQAFLESLDEVDREEYLKDVDLEPPMPDLSNPPELTPEQLAHIASLAQEEDAWDEEDVSFGQEVD